MIKSLILSCFIAVGLIFATSCSCKKNAQSADKIETKAEKPVMPDKKTTEVTAGKVENSEKPIFASIERTSCYGSCPAYKAIVYSDGEVFYEGKMYVEKKGIYTAQMSDEDMMYLFDKAKEIGYFNLEDKYDGNISDLPGCTTRITKGNQTKAIYNRHQGPQGLTDFQKLFDQVLDKQKWTLVKASEEVLEEDLD